MSDRQLFLCFLATACLFSAIGIFKQHEAEAALNNKIDCSYQLDPKLVNTLGNATYIYLGLDKAPKDNFTAILGARCAFEKANPNLEVTDMDVDSQQTGGLGSYIGDHVFGIWLSHRLKSK